MIRYVVGGPSASRSMDRRSYGMESVEDDPFILAASTHSLNSVGDSKKMNYHNVNYGYSSEGREICCLHLNPSQVTSHEWCLILSLIVYD